MKLQEKLLGRFLRYAAVTTQSKPESGKVPSTPGQWELARLLGDTLALTAAHPGNGNWRGYWQRILRSWGSGT